MQVVPIRNKKNRNRQEIAKNSIYNHKDADALSEAVAKAIMYDILTRVKVKMGGATGTTPKRVYDNLNRRNINYSYVSWYFLDEYFGSNQYRDYAMKHLGRFKPENIYVPRAQFYVNNELVDSNRLELILGENLGDYERRGPEIYIKSTCKNPTLREIMESNEDYDLRKIGPHGVDIQILGLGVAGDNEEENGDNEKKKGGHVGFDERGTYPYSLTHLTKLADTTLESNKKDFEERQETRYAITQGIGTILRANKIMLLAFGEKKAKAVRDMLQSELSPLNPAGYLRLHHNVSFYIDEPALSESDISKIRREYSLVAV